RAIAAAKGVEVTEVTVCILDRPRHAEIIAAVREVGARIHLITDGDVAGVMNTADPETGIDLYVGSGGAAEGVVGWAGLRSAGRSLHRRPSVSIDTSTTAPTTTTPPHRQTGPMLTPQPSPNTSIGPRKGMRPIIPRT